jgi:hypothetical protein
MFLEVLEGNVQSYVEANGMATSQRSNSNQPTNISMRERPPAIQSLAEHLQDEGLASKVPES